MIFKMLKLVDGTHKYRCLIYLYNRELKRMNQSTKTVKHKSQGTEYRTVWFLRNFICCNNNNETAAHMFRRKISSSLTQPLITVDSGWIKLYTDEKLLLQVKNEFMRSSFLLKCQPKITKIFALPSNKLPGQKSWKFLVGILGKMMTS